MIHPTNINGLLTLIIVCGGIGCTVIVWVILGMPWPRRREKPWKPSNVVDMKLTSNSEQKAMERKAVRLDEHERKIS